MTILHRIAVTGACLIGLSATPVLANTIGMDMQNFNPSFDNTDFVTVHASQTLLKNQFHIGLFYDEAINSIVYYDNNADIPQSRTDWNDNIGSLAVHVAYGIFDYWDVAVSIPFVLHQNVDEPGNRIQYFDTGLADVRISTKFRLWHNDKSGVAVVASTSFNKVENNPFTGEGQSRVFNLEFIADTHFDKTKVAANIGFRARTEGDPIASYPIDPINNQLIGSIAVNYPLSPKWAAIGEIYGSHPLKSGEFGSDRSLSAAEIIGGVNYYPNESWALHTGVGTELMDGLFTPDWRFYAGVNWTYPIKFNTAPKPEPKFERITVRDVLFKIDSDNLMVGDAKKHLEVLRKALDVPTPFKRLVIEGHTCDLGSEEYNKDLSQRRANRIKDMLVNTYKVDPAKIEAVGFGESDPVAENGSEQGRQKNRRVEFKIFRDE